MSLLGNNYRVVLGDEDDDDDYLDDDTEVEESKSKKKPRKKTDSDEDDEDDTDEDVIICPVCGEEVIASEEELVEGARIVCDASNGCMAELEVVGFDKQNHPRFKVVEDEK